MKLTKYLLSLSLAAAGVATFSSCEDMLDQGNSYVIYAEDDHISSSSDTVNSVVGILNKLQAIAVRTNLLGEVRADLVDVKENALVDLKNLANYNADVTGEENENIYNVPRDYYAVINNCNYFIDRVNDSLPEIHTDAMKYMFERETAAVHCIRAWAYLQCVLAYGKIPFVDKPVLNLTDSKKEYPMYDLRQICEYFVKDLEPYKNIELPDYKSFDNNTVTPKMCFFPANILMGDMYLWLAALDHDAEAAKKSAKSYYDFIVWRESGKTYTTTGTNSASWSQRDLEKAEELRSAGGSLGFSTSGTWGAASTECITSIAMDSSSATGYYNELRNIYNSTRRPELKEATVAPSEALKTLSQAQVYVGLDSRKRPVEIGTANLHEEALEHFYLGDLRFASTYSTEDIEYNDKEVKMQTINKHNTPNVLIYRRQQIYLRLAEALNYAGYPRFAKQILTMGLSNTVIDNEVRPFYTSSADTAFIDYFDFNDNDFIAYAGDYDTNPDVYGIPQVIEPQLLSDEEKSRMNQIGIHSRGSGIAFANESYLPVAEIDSTYAEFPQEALDTIGEKPVQPTKATLGEEPKFDTKTFGKQLTNANIPSTWELYGDRMDVTFEEYRQCPANKQLKESRAKTNYDRCFAEGKDSITMWKNYLLGLEDLAERMEVYSQDTAKIMNEYRTVLAAYNNRVDIYQEAWSQWHGKIYSNPAYISAEQDQVDQAILDEQALELAYEGNRFFDLMRRAYWYNDNHRLSDPIKAARPDVGDKLLDRRNWFLHYKGQIGY